MSKPFAHLLRWRPATLIVSETGLIIAAVLGAAYLRLGGAAWDTMITHSGLSKALLVAAVCQLCLYYGELYDLRVAADRGELVVRLFQAIGAASIVLAFIYYWAPSLIIGRGVFMLATIFVIVLVTGWRLAFDWVNRQVRPRERLLLVGTSPAAIRLARELHRRTELGVKIVGFVDPDPARVGEPVLNPGVIGTIEDIPAIVAAESIDRVVVGLADRRGTLRMDRLLEMRLAGVTFDHLASVYEEYTGKIAVENLRPSWFVFSTGFRRSRWLRAAKRAIDILAAVAGLVLLLPLIGIVALAIRLTSRGPVLYHQKRVGEQGRVFTIHKFRSMRADAEATTGAVWASPDDDRTTPIGGFLRRARLDELPQLLNLLRGEMSLVGPRPERPEFVSELTRQIPFYGQRHVVKPGITGWAQVRYTYGASVEDAMEKLQYDLFYIKNISISLDLFIIFKTLQTVLLRRGA
jgi:sugar transferase (PEP-CTERM system associated)